MADPNVSGAADRVHGNDGEKPQQHNNNDGHISFQPPSVTPPSAARTLNNDTDSIHEDLFPEQTHTSSVLYSKEPTLSSASTVDDIFLKASTSLKVVILICMLALPVGCHYLEATVGTLKTALKTVRTIFFISFLPIPRNVKKVTQSV